MQFSQFNSIHKVETPSKMSYLLFISSRCQNRRMSLARVAECLEIMHQSIETTDPRAPRHSGEFDIYPVLKDGLFPRPRDQ